MTISLAWLQSVIASDWDISTGVPAFLDLAESRVSMMLSIHASSGRDSPLRNILVGCPGGCGWSHKIDWNFRLGRITVLVSFCYEVAV